MKWHHDVIVPELDGLLHDLCDETKNLRSQVTRAAIQSFVKLFTHLGRDAETAKNIDSVSPDLRWVYMGDFVSQMGRKHDDQVEQA
jgi:hypothetical protein